MDIKSIIGHSVVHPTCGEGIINNVDDQFVWVEKFYESFIDPLPDDTLLTIYECTK